MTDNIIPADYHNPISQKHAAFRAIVHRPLSIPMSKKAFHKELEIIKTIAHNNGYFTNLIDRIIKHKASKIVLNYAYQANRPTSNTEIERQPRLPYIGQISYSCPRYLVIAKPTFLHNP